MIKLSEFVLKSRVVYAEVALNEYQRNINFYKQWGKIMTNKKALPDLQLALMRDIYEF